MTVNPCKCGSTDIKVVEKHEFDSLDDLYLVCKSCGRRVGVNSKITGEPTYGRDGLIVKWNRDNPLPAPPPPEPESCATCKFALTEGAAIVCRRYPPEVMRMDGALVRHWPHPHDTDWCGEYKKR